MADFIMSLGMIKVGTIQHNKFAFKRIADIRNNNVLEPYSYDIRKDRPENAQVINIPLNIEKQYVLGEYVIAKWRKVIGKKGERLEIFRLNLPLPAQIIVVRNTGSIGQMIHILQSGYECNIALPKVIFVPETYYNNQLIVAGLIMRSSDLMTSNGIFILPNKDMNIPMVSISKENILSINGDLMYRYLKEPEKDSEYRLSRANNVVASAICNALTWGTVKTTMSDRDWRFIKSTLQGFADDPLIPRISQECNCSISEANTYFNRFIEDLEEYFCNHSDMASEIAKSALESSPSLREKCHSYCYNNAESKWRYDHDEELKQANAELAKLRLEVKDLSDDILKLISEKSDIESDIDNARQNLRSAERELDEKIRHCKQQESQINDELSALNIILEERNASVSDHEKQIEELHSEIMQLTRDRDRVKNEFDETLKKRDLYLIELARFHSVHNSSAGTYSPIVDNKEVDTSILNIDNIAPSVPSNSITTANDACLQNAGNNRYSFYFSKSADYVPISDNFVSRISCISDLINTLNENLLEMGIRKELSSALASLILSSFFERQPLLFLGVGANNIVEALSISIFGRTSNSIRICSSFSKQIHKLLLDKRTVTTLKSPFQYNWIVNIPEILARSKSFCCLTHPFSEDLFIEPSSLYNYVIPILTDTLFSSYNKISSPLYIKGVLDDFAIIDSCFDQKINQSFADRQLFKKVSGIPPMFKSNVSNLFNRYTQLYSTEGSTGLFRLIVLFTILYLSTDDSKISSFLSTIRQSSCYSDYVEFLSEYTGADNE